MVGILYQKMSPDKPSDEDESPAPFHRQGQLLLEQIKARMGDLVEIQDKAEGHWGGEDGFYRFYHGSLKVYWVQNLTRRMVDTFSEIGRAAGGEGGLNSQFMKIIRQGTDKTFDLSHNLDWDSHTRPIIEAFFHAREMLRHMVRYGGELERAPVRLPSGWAAVLYLFNMR